MIAIFQPVSTLIRKFIRGERASATLEMALMVPLFVAVFLGVVEYSRLMLLRQKLEKTVSAMGDFLTQGGFACTADIDQFRLLANSIMEPFDFTNGSITFSSVVNNNTDIPPCDAGAACISWQDGEPSKIGNTGEAPELPSNLIVQQGHNYIITELFYNFEPLLPLSGNFVPGLQAQQIYLYNIHKPRMGTLATLDPEDKC